jgi:microcystin-dependent protein
MHKIDSPDATAGNEFSDGDPALGTLSTVLWAKWHNTLQRELVAIVAAAGISLSDADDNQVLEAIQAFLTAHADLTSPHSATSAATAGRLVLRNLSTGRSKIAAPAESDDIARLDTVTAQAILTCPPGSIRHYAGAGLPTGFLECNGAAINRTTYAALFAAIGTVYGAGNGSTTFNLPDFRGEFLRGWDSGRGVDPGRSLGSAQGYLVELHTHLLMAVATNSGLGGGSVALSQIAGSLVSDRIGASGGLETRPRNVAVRILIKY